MCCGQKWWEAVQVGQSVVTFSSEQEAERFLAQDENKVPTKHVALYQQLHAQRDRGLGDTIKRMTAAVGIKPCGGCQKRAEKLNRMFPYR